MRILIRDETVIVLSDVVVKMWKEIGRMMDAHVITDVIINLPS
jgi:hypothetical protein